MIDSLLPEMISVIDLILLSVASFTGSVLTAALGVGGGSLLIIIMAGLVPPLALIPLHGLVQMGSNASRAVLTREHLDTSQALFFAGGALVASVMAVALLVRMDQQWIPVIISLFILYLCWGKVPQLGLRSPLGLMTGGLLTTLATMLVGATGPLVSAWIGRSGLDKWRYTALFSTCMTTQHGLKILVFGLAGFSFLPWLTVLVCMVLAAGVGTKVGLRVLQHVNEDRFKFWFKLVLTGLAFRTLYTSFFS